MPVHSLAGNVFYRTYTDHSTRWYRSLIRLPVFLHLLIEPGFIFSWGHNCKTQPPGSWPYKCHNSCRLLTLHGTVHLLKEDHIFLPYSFLNLLSSISQRTQKRFLQLFVQPINTQKYSVCFDVYSYVLRFIKIQFVKIAN